MIQSEQSLLQQEIVKTIPQHPEVPRWHLLDKIGNGVSGDVYKAIDLTGDLEMVALKIIRKVPESYQVSN